VALEAPAFTLGEADAGAAVTLPLDGRFVYDGADDLLVDHSSGGCGGEVSLAARGGGETLGAADREAVAGLPTGWTPETTVRFSAGDAAVTIGGPPLSGEAPFAVGGGRVHLLEEAAAIGGQGRLVGVGFPVADATTGGAYAVSLRIGHTTRASLLEYLDLQVNFDETPSTIATGAPFRVPAGLAAGDRVWLPVDPAGFLYDGRRGLVLDVTAEGATGATGWLARPHPAGALARLVRGHPLATAGTLDAVAYDLALRFAGGPVTVRTPAGLAGPAADPLGAGRRQYLYLASEIGSAGEVATVACRLRADVPAGTTVDLTVRLGHLDGDRLPERFVDGLALARSGTLALAAGARAGDWLPVPLGSPVPYDGRRALVVEFSGGGAAGPLCVLDEATGAPRYAARRLAAASPLAATGGATDALIDLRFGFR
jgi:hypothetical protein